MDGRYHRRRQTLPADQSFLLRMRRDRIGDLADQFGREVVAHAFDLEQFGACDTGGGRSLDRRSAALQQSYPKRSGALFEVVGRVPGMEASQFEDAAKQAKENCPVSKALAGVPEISISARLES